MKAVVFALLLAGVPAAAVAQNETTPVPPAGGVSKPAKKPKEPRICRSENTTSSRVAVTSCHTAAEWATIDAARNTGPGKTDRVN